MCQLSRHFLHCHAYSACRFLVACTSMDLHLRFASSHFCCSVRLYCGLLVNQSVLKRLSVSANTAANLSAFNTESRLSDFHRHFLLFEKLIAKRKMRDKSWSVQFWIQVFEMRCGCFLGICIEHLFAGRRSVKMSASANTDNTRKKKMLQQFSLKYKYFLFMGKLRRRDCHVFCRVC